MPPPIGMSKFGRLLLTRERGRQIVSELAIEGSSVVLDFAEVEVASPSFLHEMITELVRVGVERVTFSNVTDAIEENLNRVLRVGDQDGKRPEVLVS